MFRFEIGARVLVRRYNWESERPSIEVLILDKIPCHIKVEVISDGWWHIGQKLWLYDGTWFVRSRVSKAGSVRLEAINP